MENTHTPQCFLLQMYSLPKVLDTVHFEDQSEHEEIPELKYSYLLREKVLSN